MSLFEGHILYIRPRFGQTFPSKCLKSCIICVLYHFVRNEFPLSKVYYAATTFQAVCDVLGPQKPVACCGGMMEESRHTKEGWSLSPEGGLHRSSDFELCLGG